MNLNLLLTSVFALALTGCATLDDSDMARLEQPEAANRCVAWLLGEDVKPPPTVLYMTRMPWHPDLGYVPGFYSTGAETIVIQQQFNQFPTLAHEMAHHYGVTEREAESVARRGRDCLTFGLSPKRMKR